MRIPTVHVHSQSDKHTQSYTMFMWETMRRLANRPDLLRLSVHCMGPTATEGLSVLPNAKTYHVSNISADQGLVGSVGHAACIEHALKLTDDGDIHIIVDSDTVVLARGWDDYVRIELLDRKVGTFGTTYEDIGGFTSGAGDVQTYKGIPNVVWMALSPLHRWQDLRALPEKETTVKITDDGMAKAYGLPIGHQVLRDVAWQIPEYLSNRNISYVGWKQHKPSTGAIVLNGLTDYHEEYHVEGGVPFVVHHRGSMRYSYRSDKISQDFYATVDAWLAEEVKRDTRWRWEPGPQHAEIIASLDTMALSSKDRVEAIEATAGKQAPPFVGPPVTPKTIEPAGTPLRGWVKITVDGSVTWSRHTAPVPQIIDLCPNFPAFVHSPHVIRIEGTVAMGLSVMVPDVSDNVPRLVIVRNMTPGPISIISRPEPSSVSVSVPSGTCWQLLIDVDGVVHVS